MFDHSSAKKSALQDILKLAGEERAGRLKAKFAPKPVAEEAAAPEAPVAEVEVEAAGDEAEISPEAIAKLLEMLGIGEDTPEASAPEAGLEG
jgi:hypothetical protein